MIREQQCSASYSEWARKYAKPSKALINLNRMESSKLLGFRSKALSFKVKKCQVIDELPILAVAGALANGTTIIRHAEELRIKETDRIAAIAHNLRVMGAKVAEMNDGLEIHGPAALHGARVASFGDHRIAMAFAVAGLFAEQPVHEFRGHHSF